MVKLSKKLVETITLPVNVTQPDIDNAACRIATKCMHKVAFAREGIKEGLFKSDAEGRIRVTAGGIRCNINGYRWFARAPKKLEVTLKAFDRGEKVKPCKYTVKLVKGTKIVKVSKERQEQINQRRRERTKAGEYVYPRYSSIRKRVVGY